MRYLTMALAAGLGAFAHAVSAQNPQKLPPSVTVDTVNAVTVQNQRNVPVWVYLEHGKFDRRLGEVKAGSTQTLRLPPWALQGVRSVRLFVHPEGEPIDLASHEFTLPRAAQLTLTVPPRGGAATTPADTMMAVIAPDELDEATLTVDNPRDVAVTVYAQSGNFDTRLGRVPAGGRATLRFPTSVVLPGRVLKVFVQPDNGLDLATETLKIVKGQHLGLRVPPR